MAFAEWFPSLDEKSLALQVLLAESAVKALAVVVVVEGLYPPVAGLNGETARHTLGCEQLVPIFFTIRQSVFKVEWRVGKYLATVSANKTLRMEGLAHRLQTVPQNLLLALFAIGSQILSVAVLTVEVTLLFDKSDLLQ